MQQEMTLRTHLFCIALLCLAGVRVSGNDHAPGSISEGHTTTSSGISIHYLQAGPRTSDRALVLIPGWRLPAHSLTGF